MTAQQGRMEIMTGRLLHLGETPTQRAKKGYAEVVRILLDHGADIPLEYERGLTPRMSAIRSEPENLKLIDELLSSTEVAASEEKFEEEEWEPLKSSGHFSAG